MCRVALVACSKQKLAHAAPARDLYRGNLFRLSRTWVEARAHVFPRWGILSARHGLVLPDTVLEPYDVGLRDLSPEQRATWAADTAQAIVTEWGAGTIYTLLAGYDYRDATRPLPYVEDLFEHWLRYRKEVQGKRGRVGNGWLMKQLKAGRGRG